MTDRKTLDQMTSNDLDQLYADRDRYQAAANPELQQRLEAAIHALGKSETELAALRDVQARTLDSMDVITRRARRAEATITRVRALCEQWVKAGPPPLGVPLARWWDRRLVELHNAIHPPTDQTQEK